MTIKCVDTVVEKNSATCLYEKQSIFKDWNHSVEQTQLPGNDFKHFSFFPLRHKPPSLSAFIYINWFLSHGMSNPLIWRSQNLRQILASLSSLIFFPPLWAISICSRTINHDKNVMLKKRVSKCDLTVGMASSITYFRGGLYLTGVIKYIVNFRQ